MRIRLCREMAVCAFKPQTSSGKDSPWALFIHVPFASLYPLTVMGPNFRCSLSFWRQLLMKRRIQLVVRKTWGGDDLGCESTEGPCCCRSRDGKIRFRKTVPLLPSPTIARSLLTLGVQVLGCSTVVEAILWFFRSRSCTGWTHPGN